MQQANINNPYGNCKHTIGDLFGVFKDWILWIVLYSSKL